jgi:hypothetical protein
MLTAPPVPPEDAPDPIDTDPVVPELDVPELKLSRPLTPAAPAFAVLIVTAPLVVAVPKPLVRPRAPPVSALPSPATKSSKPPSPPTPPLP